MEVKMRLRVYKGTIGELRKIRNGVKLSHSTTNVIVDKVISKYPTADELDGLLDVDDCDYAYIIANYELADDPYNMKDALNKMGVEPNKNGKYIWLYNGHEYVNGTMNIRNYLLGDEY